MPKVQHLIETRFSLQTSRMPLTSEWLDYRLELLRRYTLPSVASQTESPFTWLLFCDRSTDADVLERLSHELHRVPGAQLALTGGGRAPLDLIRSAVDDDTDVLITTRLDSDDAIAKGYVELIQSYAAPFHRSAHERMVLNCPRGYRFDIREETGGTKGRLYRDWMPNSPFHSLFERPGIHRPETVLAGRHECLRRRYSDHQRLEQLRGGSNDGHGRLHQHYPTHQDDSMPAWLIVIHGGNVVNRVPPTAYEQPPGARPAGIALAP